MKTTISVCVCTYNPRIDVLVQVLLSIESQLEGGDELLVIDNNSTESLKSIIQLSRFYDRIIVEKRQGLNHARECAVKHSSSEVILFVDDDNILAPDFILHCRGYHSNKDVGILGCAVYPYYEELPEPWFAKYEELLAIRKYPYDFEYETKKPELIYLPIGAGMSVKRMLAIQYFDDVHNHARIEGRNAEVLTSCEDLDLALFVLNSKHRVIVSGKMSIRHVLPKARTSEKYIKRILDGNTKSLKVLNDKWYKVYGVNVVDFNSKLRFVYNIKLIVSILLSPFSIHYRIYSQVFKSILASTN